MRTNFEYMTNLQYKVKALQAQVDAYQSIWGSLSAPEGRIRKKTPGKRSDHRGVKKRTGQIPCGKYHNAQPMDGSVRGYGEGTQESHIERTEGDSPDETASARGRKEGRTVA